jgi:hypothetical protein
MTNAATITPDPKDLLLEGRGTVHNRSARLVREGERDVVRLDARPGDGLAWWHDVAFDTGTIAFEVRGKNQLQRSFVGVAFHGAQEGQAADASYEAVYFRPFNFVAEDPVRRRHMVQYICAPEFHWQRLRDERPDQFEATVDPIPDPDDWFAARVEVSERQVRVHVAGSEAPSLVVERLSTRRGGWVGFWVGNGSDGDFATLTLTPPATAQRGEG